MIIEEIFPPHIYSVRYDDEEDNGYDRLFNEWNDMGYVTTFMENHNQYLSSPVWSQTPTPEDASRQVYEEAKIMENHFEELAENSANDRTPNFDSLFRFLNGKYQYELEIPPMKSYGPKRPSLLRMYAIKLQKNCYLITGGGIKLADTIQNSPGLQDHALQNIDKVRDFLFANGISDSEDI